MAAFTLRMTLEKKTKHTVRYESKDAGAPVRTLYISKEAFSDGKFPETVTLTVSSEKEVKEKK